MAILSARNLAQSFGAEDLFGEIDVRLNAKERVGLVGANGSGKTTLLHILAGLQEPRTGEVITRRELSLGLLQQEAVLAFRGQENTIYAEMLTVFGDLTAMQTEMREMEGRMEAGDFSEALLEMYGKVQNAFEMGGGWDFSAEIKLTLIGLGFSEEMWQTPLSHLSGGQKTRVLLARLLLEKPDLLILDEPTNHLDGSAVEWLENTLRKWSGTLIIVSHDRYFLDKIVTAIWELTPSALKTYQGDYTNYVARRAQDWEREETLFKAKKGQLDKDFDFIRQHMADGQSDQAKGKLKRLTREIVLLENFPPTELEGKSWIEIGGRTRTFSANEAAKRLRGLRMVSSKPPVMKVRLESAETSDKLVLRSKNLRAGYDGDDNAIITSERLRIERGDRIAILGDNGSGKSTFIKALLKSCQLSPQGYSQLWVLGDVKVGDNLTAGYFAQAHDQLSPENRVVDELLASAAIGMQQARNILASYLFRGHAVFKKVRDLSGGERGRLALAILATQGANFLLLDEPTNHLDIPSQEVLQSVLEQYDGTLIFVSHDRYLVSKLATQVWSIRAGKLHVYEGGYGDYLEKREFEREATENRPKPKTDEALEKSIENILAFQHDFEPEELSSKQWRKRLGELEPLLDAAEARAEELQMQIADAKMMGVDTLLAELAAELLQVEGELDELSAEWDALMQQ